MAQKTVVSLTDDLDGSKAERTVSFGLDGTNYEIELSKRNAAALAKSLERYVAAGRKVRVSASRVAGTGASRAVSRTDLPAIRAWARRQKLEVSDRGRIAKSLQEAYDAAH